MPKLFSSRNRAPHLGPYPLERLPRSNSAPSAEGLAGIPPLRLPAPRSANSAAGDLSVPDGEYPVQPGLVAQQQCATALQQMEKEK